MVREGSPGGRSETTGVGHRICETSFKPRVSFKPGVKEGVVDENNGESKEEEVTDEGIGEPKMEELVPE